MASLEIDRNTFAADVIFPNSASDEFNGGQIFPKLGAVSKLTNNNLVNRL